MASSFSIQLDREANDTLEEYNKFRRKVVLAALTGVVLKTPVDTGRARGNWQVSAGKPKNNEVAKFEKRGSGETRESRGAAVAGSSIEREVARVLGSLRGVSSDAGKFATVFITNNVPYILRLENGYSKQAPKGMVALTLEELKSRFGR